MTKSIRRSAEKKRQPEKKPERGEQGSERLASERERALEGMKVVASETMQRRSELGQVDVMIDAADDLPATVADALRAEVTIVQEQLAILGAEQATLEAKFRSLSAEDYSDVAFGIDEVSSDGPAPSVTNQRPPERARTPNKPEPKTFAGVGSRATRFRPFTKLPLSLSGEHSRKLLDALGIAAAAVTQEQLIAQSGMAEADLLAKINEVSQAEFDRDPWNQRTIPIERVLQEYSSDMNAMADDFWEEKVHQHADAAGMLSLEDIRRLVYPRELPDDETLGWLQKKFE